MTRLGRHLRGRAGLWWAFVLVHVWLFWGLRHGPHDPLYDVTHVYLAWVRTGLAGGPWIGVDVPWVYPLGALAPMLLAAGGGLAAYGVTWLVIVTSLNAAACLLLDRLGGAVGRRSALWWVAFLAALGPISLARIDAVTAPLAIVALLIVQRRPALASGLLTFAACVKIWPGAVLAAMLVVSRQRPRILLGSASVVLAVFGLPAALQVSPQILLGFISRQSGRGLQLESPATVPWLWMKAFGSHAVEVHFEQTIRTFEVTGPAARPLGTALSTLMVVLFLALLLLGVRALRSGASPAEIAGPLALALTLTLIVTNKVGSPQFETWIAPSIVAGMLLHPRGGPSFRTAAGWALAAAALTQIIYPWAYDGLVHDRVAVLVVITVRDLILLGLLATSAHVLRTHADRRGAQPPSDQRGLRTARQPSEIR